MTHLPDRASKTHCCWHILTDIKSKYCGKRAQIWLLVNTNIGAVYRANPGVHVWAANDESLQMPQWAVCHTERREQSRGASPTPGHNEVTEKKHTQTHRHTLSFPSHYYVCICCLTPEGSCVGGDEWASSAARLINTTTPPLPLFSHHSSHRKAE